MKKMFWLSIGLLLATGFAAGCGAVSATEKIDRAIQETADVKTFHNEFDLALTTRTQTAAEGIREDPIALRGEADVDRGDGTKAKGKVSIDGIENLVRLLLGEQAGGQNLGLLSAFVQNVQFVVIEDKSYVNLQGNWFDTGAAFQDLLGNFTLGLEAGLMRDSCFENALRDPDKFGSSDLLKDLEELPSEKIDGVDTQHFTASIDWDKALAHLQNVLRECDRPESAAAVETLKKDIQEIFKISDVELWIDGDDIIRQAKISLELMPGGLTSILGVNPQVQSIALALSSKISRVGEDFQIDTPEGEIRPLTDILPLLEGIFGRPIDLGGAAGGPNPFAR